MRERLQVTVDRLGRELEQVTSERDKLAMGTEIQHVKWQRDVLAQFCKACSLWGVLPCRCADRADDALRRAGLNDEPTGQ
jgi:hypothetical protein